MKYLLFLHLILQFFSDFFLKKKLFSKLDFSFGPKIEFQELIIPFCLILQQIW